METNAKRKMTREEIEALVRALRPEPGRKMTREEIAALVRGLGPVDWVQLRLKASVSPAKRVLAGVGATEFARAALRGTFHRRFPELTQSELNMKVLAYLTPVRMPKL